MVPVRLTVQGFAVPEGQAGHVAVVDGADGVAVSVTVVPLVNACVMHGPGLSHVPKPVGLLVTLPGPPVKITLNGGFPLPPPDPVKQTTFPVMYPVTTAPEDESPPALLFVVNVADTSVVPQLPPVAVSSPLELTVIIPVSFELQVTSLVMSFVTGGWMYVPKARSCTCSPASLGTGIFESPNVSTLGWTWIDTNCWSRPQLDTVSSTPATTTRAMTLNHFPLMQHSRVFSGLGQTSKPNNNARRGQM